MDIVILVFFLSQQYEDSIFHLPLFLTHTIQFVLSSIRIFRESLIILAWKYNTCFICRISSLFDLIALVKCMYMWHLAAIIQINCYDYIICINVYNNHYKARYRVFILPRVGRKSPAHKTFIFVGFTTIKNL